MSGETSEAAVRVFVDALNTGTPGAWLAWRMLRRWPQVERLRTPVLYGIGSVAAYWSWLRVAAIFA